MNVKKTLDFFENASEAVEGKIIVNELGGSLLQLDVSGTGTFEIKVEARVGFGGEFREVLAIADKNYSKVAKIIESGFYKVDISGFTAYKVSLVSATAPVTCKGIEV